MENFGILLIALLVGVALGAVGAWLVLRRSAASEVMADTAATDAGPACSPGSGSSPRRSRPSCTTR